MQCTFHRHWGTDPENTFLRVEEGCAVFSRLPILHTGYQLLPKDPNDQHDVHQRALVHVEVDTPIGKVQTFTTHLALSSAARELSVVKIWNYMKDFPGTLALMGDFNAEPAEDAMQFLIGNRTLAGTKTEGLVDAWTAVHPDKDGLTFNTLDKKLVKRIDYMMLRPSAKTEMTRVKHVPTEEEHMLAKEAAQPKKEACRCKQSWTSPTDGGTCATEQEGCTMCDVQATGAQGAAWCMIENPGCMQATQFQQLLPPEPPYYPFPRGKKSYQG